MKLCIIFILAVLTLESDACSQDCGCSDFVVARCHDPPSVENIHTTDIHECKQTCDVFSSFGECSFFQFTTEHVDENCKMIQLDMSTWMDACDTQGQALKDSDGKCLSKDCSKFDTDIDSCPSGCVSCESPVPCAGFVEYDCSPMGVPTLTVDDVDYEECQKRCISEGSASFMLYYKEEAVCECYATGERSCSSFAV